MRTQMSIPEQVASAAAQMPQRNTPRKRNSRMALITDMKIFRSILPRINPQIRRKLSTAKMIVVIGEQMAYTRRYWTAKSANSPSAPIRRISSGAAANRMPPITTPAPTIIRQAQVKMLFASCSSFRPRQMEIGTAEPTPIRSASEKLMMTNGMARLSAAKAVAPRNCPTKTPSSVWYSAEASMLTAPGMEAMKKSFSGGVFANNAFEFISGLPSPFKTK